MHKRASKGYTMVEMMVVLAIIALMMVIVIPRLAFPKKGAALKGAASDIMSAMRTARRLAITERVEHAVIIYLDAVPTQYFIAKYDSVFDPRVPDAMFNNPIPSFPGHPTGPIDFRAEIQAKADPTDIFRDDNADNIAEYPPTDSYVYANWKAVGEWRTLPENIMVSDIKSAAGSFNVKRTEDNDLDGVLNGDQYIPADPTFPSCDGDTYYEEDTGADGVLCTQGDTYRNSTAQEYFHDAGEHDGIISPVYQVIRFQPTGTSDKAVIHLWDITDARREVPTGIHLPPSLVQLGIPPNLNLKYQALPPYQKQDDYLQIISSSSSDDTKYYTVVVNPITGSATVYDYAWGEGGTGDWDRKKDGQ